MNKTYTKPYNDLVVLDCESYPNYSLFAFKNIQNDKIKTIEIKGKDSFLTDEQRTKLNTIIQKRITFGFNSRNYDIPIILYALKRSTSYQLYNMSNRIIKNNNSGWKTLKDFNLYGQKL